MSVLSENQIFTPKERQREINRWNYQRNKKYYADGSKKWRSQNPESYRELNKRYHASVHGRSKKLFNAARRRALVKELPFDLSIEWVNGKLSAGLCELTGLPFKFSTLGNRSRDPYAPSIDRIDNSKGYTSDNCRVILWALNASLSTWGEDVYRTIAETYLSRRTEYDL